MNLLTLKEAAAQFRRSPKVFAKHVRATGVPFVQIGRSMLFDPDVVATHLTTTASDDAKPALFRPLVKRAGKGSRFATEVGL
jgi:2,4-dienoyl-CoA reductase-like NADH-dependent reductase (Old Yellow Enzyme family)